MVATVVGAVVTRGVLTIVVQVPLVCNDPGAVLHRFLAFSCFLYETNVIKDCRSFEATSTGRVELVNIQYIKDLDL